MKKYTFFLLTIFFTLLAFLILCYQTSQSNATTVYNFGSGTTASGVFIDVPDIQFNFQIPSYVTDKNVQSDSFICDVTKSECKINFDLSPSFTGDFKSSNFLCHIDGIGLTEAEKCNPNTVIFSTGTTEVTFTIRSKIDSSFFKSRTIIIQNGTSPDNSNVSDSGSISSSSGIVNSGSIAHSGSTSTGIMVPDIRLTFQQATYFVDKNPELSVFDCDPTKSECKVNFNLEESFTGSFRESDYTCQTDGIAESESGKCNPSQVTFGTGEYVVAFFIKEKNNPANFHSRQILIRGAKTQSGSNNTESGALIDSGATLPSSSGSISLSGAITETGSLVDSGATNTGLTNTGIFIPEPMIDIQSGLSGDFTCAKEECIVNFTGEGSFGSGTKMSDYSCLWSFSGAKVMPSVDSCNPGYIHYLPGNYEIHFRITSKQNSQIFKEKTLLIKNTYQSSNASAGGGGGATTQVPTTTIDSNIFSLEIVRASPNPKGSDSLEWIEIQNKSSKTTFLKDCTLRDASGKQYVFPPEYTISRESSEKFFSSVTHLSLTNTGDAIELFCSGQKISRFSWDFPVPDDYVIESKYQNAGRNIIKIQKILSDGTFEIENAGKIEQIELLGVAFDVGDQAKLIESLNQKYDGKIGQIEYEKEQTQTGYIWIDGENIGKSLIREGKARYVPTPLYKYQKLFEGVSNEAKKEGIGFWAEKNLIKLAKKRISENKKGIDSDSQKQQEKSILEATKFSIKHTKENQVLVSGKSFPNTEIGILFLTDEPDSFTGAQLEEKFDSEAVISKTGGDGNWNYSGINLPPGKYFVLAQVRLGEDEGNHILEEKHSITIKPKTEPKTSKKSTKKETEKQSDVKAEFSLSLQSGRNSKISFQREKIFCIGKTCAVNLKIEETKKGVFVYEWDFGGGKKQYGNNPKSVNFLAGKHQITLRALNKETGEYITRIISVSVQAPPKKLRKNSRKKSGQKKSSQKMNIEVQEPQMLVNDNKNSSSSLFIYIGIILTSGVGFGHLAWKKWGKGENENLNNSSTFEKK